MLLPVWLDALSKRAPAPSKNWQYTDPNDIGPKSLQKLWYTKFSSMLRHTKSGAHTEPERRLSFRLGLRFSDRMKLPEQEMLLRRTGERMRLLARQQLSGGYGESLYNHVGTRSLRHVVRFIPIRIICTDSLIFGAGCKVHEYNWMNANV